MEVLKVGVKVSLNKHSRFLNKYLSTQAVIFAVKHRVPIRQCTIYCFEQTKADHIQKPKLTQTAGGITIYTKHKFKCFRIMW